MRTLRLRAENDVYFWAANAAA